jgi:hypothetical protein
MVHAKTRSGARDREPQGPSAGLGHLQAMLADTVATARAQGGSLPTVRQLARQLGVDTDLVLLALGTAPRSGH